MRRLGFVAPLALVASLLNPAPALAWNDRGHKTVAYIAYNSLSTGPSNNVRQRVDKLLSLHPQYDDWTQNVPTAQRGLVAFMQASVWPDDIKNDPTRKDCTTTPANNTFAEVCRQGRWHYFDLPFSTDGTATVVQQPPHAYSVILDAMQTLSLTSGPPNLAEVKAYKLTWLTHIIGDIHQPLHATERFGSGNAKGDGGGNGYAIQPFTPEGGAFPVSNLHSFWDNVLGVRHGHPQIVALGNELASAYRREPNTQPTNPAVVWSWFVESHGLGRHYVYAIDLDRTGQGAPPITPVYLRYANEIARQRVALAGFRLADLLNEHLR